MSWALVAFIWIGLSFSLAPFIGRAIRFGMTGEIHPPLETSEPIYPIAEVTLH